MDATAVTFRPAPPRRETRAETDARHRRMLRSPFADNAGPEWDLGCGPAFPGEEAAP